MRYVIPALWLIFLISGCAGLKQNQDPIADIQYYNTKELLEMRESMQAALQPYKGLPNDMTNRKQLTSLKDETAGIYKRKKAQIERELKRRYTAGEAAAYYAGVDDRPAAEAVPTP